MAQKIISAGHICLDITPVFPGAAEGQSIDALLRPGKLLRMEGADVHTGGSVANTGLALKKLGNEVELLGKIGMDAFGETVKRIAAGYGAGGLIEDADCATSYSVVLAIPGHDRIFLHDPGANDSFSAADISDAALDGAALFHFGYPPLMRRMYADGGRELAAMFRRVKERGIATSLDLAAVDPASEAGHADWRGILKSALPYVDFFEPSFEEICFMLDRERYERLNADSGMDVCAEALTLAEELLGMGCRTALIKCGTAGMVYKTASAEAFRAAGLHTLLDLSVWADKTGVQPCFKAERVLSATGAGDTAIAAFLTAVLRSSSLTECAALAAAEGACCVTAYDALSGLKPIETLREMISSGWETV